MLINDDNRKWIILVAGSMSFGLIMLDETVVAVALPTMQRDLSMSVLSSHWVINSYLLVIAGFIAVGGKLGDVTGYRTLFAAGILVFGIFSLIAGFAQNALWIITARLFQGFGAAVIFPASMALVALSFPPNQRGMAMGVYGTIGSSCSALGPLIGGYLSDVISWRWIFWINVPLIILIVIGFLAAWREPIFDGPRPSIDIKGLFTLVFGLGALVLAIMQGDDWGWRSALIIGLFIASFVFLSIFAIVELKISAPLIEIDLFRNMTFTSSNMSIFTGQFTKIAVIVFGALYLQEVIHLDPLKAGFALLPAMAPIPIMAIIAGYTTDRYGPRYQVLFGLILAAAALLSMGLTAGTDRYLYIVPSLMAWGISVAWMFAPALVAVMNSVPSSKQGQASGIVLTAQIFGATIGVAILSAVLRDMHSYRAVFLTSAGVALVAFAFSWLYLDRYQDVEK